MAYYRPLVLISGFINQLPAGAGVVTDEITEGSKGSIGFLTNVESVATSGVQLDTFASGTYNTAHYSVQAKRGNEVHSTEIKLIHNNTTVYTSEYGTVYSSGLLATYSGELNGSQVDLNAYSNSSSSTIFKIIRNAQAY